MTDCRHLDDYLAGAPGSPEHDAFEAHLSQCESCRTAVAQWNNVKQQFAGWVTDHEALPTPTADDASQFRAALQQKMQKTAPRALRRRQAIIGLALAAGLLFAAGVVFFRPADEAAPTDLRTRTASVSPAIPAPVPAPAGEAPTWQATDRPTAVSLESGDRLLLTAGSTATALHLSADAVSLRLHRGTVVCDVRPRNGTGSFTVAAGDVTVTVTGTRFAVQRNNGGVRVAVEKGSVQVARSNEVVALSAGQSVTAGDRIGAVADGSDDDRLLFAGLPAGGDGSSPAAATRGKTILPVAKDMDAWRALILNGQADLADAQMRAWLARHPGDAEVLMLRGNSLRRQSEFEEALQVYDAAIEKGGADTRSTARYLAGDIAGRHLRRHALAIGYFEAYLATAPTDAPNRAEAALRLSDSLAATGRTAEARRRLEDIIATFGRTPVANEARKRLEALP